jgi:hypothetical protein
LLQSLCYRRSDAAERSAMTAAFLPSAPRAKTESATPPNPVVTARNWAVARMAAPIAPSASCSALAFRVALRMLVSFPAPHVRFVSRTVRTTAIAAIAAMCVLANAWRLGTRKYWTPTLTVGVAHSVCQSHAPQTPLPRAQAILRAPAFANRQRPVRFSPALLLRTPALRAAMQWGLSVTIKLFLQMRARRGTVRRAALKIRSAGS